MTQQKAAKMYAGPDGVTQYNVANTQEMQAWEDAWADHLGKTHAAPEVIEDVVKAARRVVVAVDPTEKARHAEAVAYITDYRGTWGFILDLRADRRWGSRYFSLSPRQVEVVLNSKAREAGWARERAEQAAKAPQRPALGGTRAVTTITQDGFYKHGGDIVKVQVAVHGSGNLYAKRLVVEAQGMASWEYMPGLVTKLTEDERLTLEQAQEFGRLYGVCGICGRTLTDERSIADGIGPICAGRAFGE